MIAYVAEISWACFKIVRWRWGYCFYDHSCSCCVTVKKNILLQASRLEHPLITETLYIERRLWGYAFRWWWIAFRDRVQLFAPCVHSAIRGTLLSYFHVLLPCALFGKNNFPHLWKWFNFGSPSAKSVWFTQDSAGFLSIEWSYSIRKKKQISIADDEINFHLIDYLKGCTASEEFSSCSPRSLRNILN